jgi:glucose/arabinose dehydrogenase
MRKALLSACLIVSGIGASVGAVPLTPIPRGDISIQLQTIATGLAAPLYGFSPPGDTHRLFVLDQNGLVRIIQDGALLPTPALNIQSRVAPPLVLSNANDERGLLGISFHPGFNDPASPGFHTLYTYNSEAVSAGTPTFPVPAGAPATYRNVVNEWKMSTTDPNVIDPASRREIVSFGKNAANHNGGTIAWGPDGYMYLGLGDGGNANDSGTGHIVSTGNAQDLSVPLGKLLRINPLNPTLNPTSTDAISSNGQYRIPASNPFVSTAGALPEIYAYGFRNPYRWSFDTATGDLIMGDVGQNTIEEIDKVIKGGNYGWAIKEGDFLFNRTTGPGGTAGTVGARSPGSPAGLIDPISGPAGTLEYDHGDGISITGGFVYRGTKIPQLTGKYVFGDLALIGSPVRINGRLFYADLQSGQINEFVLPQFAGNIMPDDETVHGFGQDADGNLYVMATNTAPNGAGGVVYEIVVPEPASFCAIALGMLAFGMSRRLRKN